MYLHSLQSTLVSLLLSPFFSEPATAKPTNPIIPGFHPDPSCIYLPEWNNTFFCVTSSFSVFPGLPIYASQDLKHWRQIGNALSRPEQLPALAEASGWTSGIWAPSLRFHGGTFYIVTTLVFDEKAWEDSSRWYNVIFETKDPYQKDAWSDPVHFEFDGMDTSPFWDVDGTVYIQGSHYWRIEPSIDQITVNLTTGETGGKQVHMWSGTGGMAPEAPHLYLKDGYYYLMLAEGGTGMGHMVTMARSKSIHGPYDPAPDNPLLSNAGTNAYFQTVGHADLFQDGEGNWWAVALSTRCGPENRYYPMGRETVLTKVNWAEGEFPVFTPITGVIDGPELPDRPDVKGDGILLDTPESVTFAPGSSLPMQFMHWRLPDPAAFTISPPDHPNTLRVLPSTSNLNGRTSSGKAALPTLSFVGRRQEHTEFRFGVDIEYSPSTEGEEAGVTVFLAQNHHIDYGIVCLPSSNSSSCTANSALRIRTTNDGNNPSDTVVPLPPFSASGIKLRLEIHGTNIKHYTFKYGSKEGGQAGDELSIAGYGDVAAVSAGFTGSLLGVYATGNGNPSASSPAYFSDWQYVGTRQVIDNE